MIGFLIGVALLGAYLYFLLWSTGAFDKRRNGLDHLRFLVTCDLCGKPGSGLCDDCADKL